MTWLNGNYVLQDPNTRNRKLGIIVSEIIYEEWVPFDAKKLEPWDLEWSGNGNHGTIRVEPTGVLSIETTGAGGTESGPLAIMWHDQPLEGEIMLEFQASTVPPSDNDINCIWSASEKSASAQCSIGGIGGWWNSYTGIEQQPPPDSGHGNTRHLTKTDLMTVGQIYKVAAGRLLDNDFLFVDERLMMQVSNTPGTSPDPSFLAISTWTSHIHVWAIRISRIAPGLVVEVPPTKIEGVGASTKIT